MGLEISDVIKVLKKIAEVACKQLKKILRGQGECEVVFRLVDFEHYAKQRN